MIQQIQQRGNLIQPQQNQEDGAINEKTGKQKEGEEQIEVKNLNHLSLYYTYIQRYYTTYESKAEYVHMHSNGLFMIRPKLSILPSKPTQINYLLEQVQVKGKKKRGGVKVKPNTHIAQIKCQGEQIIKFAACVEGTIIESNNSIKLENLEKDQSYFIIILPSRRFVPQQAGMQRIIYQGNPFKFQRK